MIRIKNQWIFSLIQIHIRMYAKIHETLRHWCVWKYINHEYFHDLNKSMSFWHVLMSLYKRSLTCRFKWHCIMCMVFVKYWSKRYKNNQSFWINFCYCFARFRWKIEHVNFALINRFFKKLVFKQESTKKNWNKNQYFCAPKNNRYWS